MFFLKKKFLCVSSLSILLLYTLASCTGVQGSKNYESAGQSSFYGEFTDIPIPREMNSATETNVVVSADNMKTGQQSFIGRVEAGSLVQVMQENMNLSGWNPKAATRGKTSLLLFEKPERYCVIYIVDGPVFTEMHLYIFSKSNAPASVNESAVPPAPRPYSDI